MAGQTDIVDGNSVSTTRNIRMPRAGSHVLWMDVTHTSRVKMRAGIPRIVRGLYRELGNFLPVFPVQWIEWPGGYGRIRPGAPEERRLASAAAPGGLARAVESWTRWARTRRLRKAAAFAPGAIWLVPEPFWEKRAAYWVRRPGTATRRIAIFYDATPLTALSEASPRRRARYDRYLKALSAFDSVVAISHETGDDLRAFWDAHGLGGTRVLVEPLPCDFATQPRQATPNFGAKRILVVSTLDAHKNHLRFLHACDLLWKQGVEFSVDLIGRPSGRAGHRVRAAIESFANAGRPIAWRETVDEPELLESYRRCSFTVYPSLKEGFGLPILESLWHGRPCVCGSNGALGESSSGGGCATADQTNPASLAAGMRLLLSDHEAYLRLYDESMRRSFRTWSDFAIAMAALLTGRPPDGETQTLNNERKIRK